MGSKASTTLIWLGCLMMLSGLVLLASALSQGQDQSIAGGGICAFAFGSLVTAGGIYTKARVLQAANAGANPAKSQPKQSRGGCDLCGTEVPAVMCRTHQLHLCPTCLTRHFDTRTCLYLPSTRRPAAKAAWA